MQILLKKDSSDNIFQNHQIPRKSLEPKQPISISTDKPLTKNKVYDSIKSKQVTTSRQLKLKTPALERF